MPPVFPVGGAVRRATNSWSLSPRGCRHVQPPPPTPPRHVRPPARSRCAAPPTTPPVPWRAASRPPPQAPSPRWKPTPPQLTTQSPNAARRRRRRRSAVSPVATAPAGWDAIHCQPQRPRPTWHTPARVARVALRAQPSLSREAEVLVPLSQPGHVRPVLHDGPAPVQQQHHGRATRLTRPRVPPCPLSCPAS